MDRITAVDVFLRTIACGSISGAANELDMSRSMATRYIVALETWADARLLHRTTRRLSLTPAGEAIVPMCQKIMALSQDITLLGGQDSEAPKRIGTPIGTDHPCRILPYRGADRFSGTLSGGQHRHPDE